MVVGAERMGDSEGFDSLLRESSSSTSSSSTGVAGASSLLSSSSSSFDGVDSLEMGVSWPLCDLNAPRMPPQLLVRLLFSFTCGFDRMQPLKSNGTASPSSESAAAGGGLHLAVLILESEDNLFEHQKSSH